MHPSPTAPPFDEYPGEAAVGRRAPGGGRGSGLAPGCRDATLIMITITIIIIIIVISTISYFGYSYLRHDMAGHGVAGHGRA